MEPGIRAIAETIHASKVRAVLHVTGGGARALGWLTSVPRCSNTLLDARVPYARESALETLGRATDDDVESYCSREVAEALASAAYARAVRHGSSRATASASDARATTGLGATCALTTEDVVKRGDHRCFVAAKTLGRMTTYEMRLEKTSGRSRFDEEGCASRLVLRALYEEARRSVDDADADAGVDLVREVLSEREFDEVSVTTMEDSAYANASDARAVVERWLAEDDSSTSGATTAAPMILEFTGGVLTAVGATRANVVLSGSFNPLHDGHRDLLAAATATKPPGALGAYEIGVTNADKGTLSIDEIMRRLEQFSTPDTVCLLTKTPLFVDKTRAAPGAAFVVGADTAARLLDPKYAGSDAALDESLNEIRANACDFLVAGRVDRVSRAFVPAADVLAAAAARRAADLFAALPSFRVDVSSTEIRNAARDSGRD